MVKGGGIDNKFPKPSDVVKYKGIFYLFALTKTKVFYTAPNNRQVSDSREVMGRK